MLDILVAKHVRICGHFTEQTVLKENMFGDIVWTNLEIWQIATLVGLHFCLGYCVGLSVFCLIWTILSHLRSELDIQDSFITGSSLLVALSCSVLVHILEDFYVGLF